MSALHLSISDEAYNRLARRAQLFNITVEQLAVPLLEQAFTEETLPLTGAAWQKAFDEFNRETALRAGRYPKNYYADDSREAIYGEREDYKP